MNKKENVYSIVSSTVLIMDECTMYVYSVAVERCIAMKRRRRGVIVCGYERIGSKTSNMS